MRWPWERRGDSATQLALQSIEARAAGETAEPERLAACRAAARLYGGAFEGATVEGVELGSEWLPRAVRSMLLDGESLHVLELRRGRFSLLPAASWDVHGGISPDDWTYRADLSGPSGSLLRTRGRDGVVWLPWETDAIEPWRGRGPWHRSAALDALAALESASEAEGRSPSGRVTSVPKAMTETVRSAVARALGSARGKAVLIDQLKDYGGAPGESAMRFQRLGFDAPVSLPQLRRELEESVLSAAGVPAELAYGSSGGATGSREAFRRWYHVAVQPLARRVEGELSRAFEREVKVSLRDLGAADIASRARAFGSLVKGGMEVPEAKAVAGVG